MSPVLIHVEKSTPPDSTCASILGSLLFDNTVKSPSSLTFAFYKVLTTLQQTISKRSTHWNPSPTSIYSFLSLEGQHYQISTSHYTIKAMIMPAVSQFLIENPPSQSNNREKMENKAEASDERGLVVVLIVALFALFLATTSYCQRWPFSHIQVAPSSIPSPFVRACPPTLYPYR